MSETVFRIRNKINGLFMHNRISWSDRGVFIKSLEEAQNNAFWAGLDPNNFEIIEYVLNQEKIYEITKSVN